MLNSLNMLSEITTIIKTLSFVGKNNNNVDKQYILKKILAETRGAKKYTCESMIKRLILMFIYEELSPIDFITTCALADIKVKRLGYLGVMLIKNNELCIMMINTLKYDLQNVDSMNYALRYICNFANRSSIFQELKSTDILNSGQQNYYQKRLIAYYALNTINNDNFKLVEVSCKYLALKLQILIDNHLKTKSIYEIYDNDIMYLLKTYRLVKDVYVKIQLLRFFRICCHKADLIFMDGFINILEKTIMRSYNENNYMIMSLSLEATKLLLTHFPDNQVSNKYTLYLLGSKKYYLNICSLNIVKRYKIQEIITINYFIDKGLGEMHFLTYFVDLINNNTYEFVYNQLNKFKIRLIRHKLRKYFDEEIIIRKIIEKIFKCATEEKRIEILKYYYIYLSDIMISEYFNIENLELLYWAIESIENVKIFKIIYQLIEILNIPNYLKILKQHYRIILNNIKFDILVETRTIQDLIDFSLKYGDLLDNYEVLLHEINYAASIGCKNDDRLTLLYKTCDFLSSIFKDEKYILDEDFLIWYSTTNISEFKKIYKIQMRHENKMDLVESKNYAITSRISDLTRAKYEIELIDFEEDVTQINIQRDHKITTYEIK